MKTRGKEWDGKRLHLIKRKWLAGQSAETIHKETGWGIRRLKEEIARLRREHPEAPGGRRRLPTLRRIVTVAKALSCKNITPKRRTTPPTAAVVNGEVRRVPEFRETSVRTTVRDIGTRRVVRSMGIWFRRDAAVRGPEWAARTLRQLTLKALESIE